MEIILLQTIVWGVKTIVTHTKKNMGFFCKANISTNSFGNKNYAFILNKEIRDFLKSKAYELTNLIVDTFKTHAISGNKQ